MDAVMRRLVWFAGGVVAGASGAGYVKRKVAATAERLTPTNVAKGVGDSVRRSGRRVATAVKTGRDASRAREREARAEREGRLVRLGEYLHPGDEVLVDGRPVESGRVILMRRRDPTNR
jgi:hypothetical protein